MSEKLITEPSCTGTLIEEDEINLLDLLLVLLKHKLLIFFMVFIAGAAAVFYSLGLTNIYRSEATISPREAEKSQSSSLAELGPMGGMVAGQLGLSSGGNLTKLETVLNSRELTARIINKYSLMPVIFIDIWDKDNEIWTSEEEPTIQDGLKAVMENMLKVSVDIEKNIIKIGFEHQDPETAKKVVEYYLKELSETLRESVLQDSTEKIRFFTKVIDRTSDALLKNKIYNLLAAEIEKETFARVEKYYSFEVLDSPIAPDEDKKVRPKRAIICILSVFVAFFMAVFIAFFKEFVYRIKIDDPERYEQIVNAMKLWRKK
ncbi:Chain length determinant protein domain-containing protein [Desulfonema limicola]|uniref:Chain length determinant protein domain-containing protein n=1 Tax=Desulfonema limicola TaxID=45656 RepID=A0A975BDA2_9BACT|nr:Wzz/FepE/Etk N-terminal domain-containing protein [Desulfonema limicola]QTA83213.1 Chain length determinant protein domain-containing protein [Desulfonema limicola]